MKAILSILLLIFLSVSGYAGPPEPPEAPEPPSVNIPDIKISIDTAKINKMARSFGNMDSALAKGGNDLNQIDSSLARLDKILQRISDSIAIKDINIAGDSIVIILSNDSILTFQASSSGITAPGKDNSFVNVGGKYTVEEGKVINGNIVNIGGDVIVKGTVNGSVWTLGSDIYVAPTGYVRDGAIAVSGKLKVEPGGQVTNLKLALNESRRSAHESSNNIFRVMAAVFLGIYIVWMILAATFTSFMKDNVGRVAQLVSANPWRNFFVGYLAYLLAFAAIIVLIISILGIPLAFVGVPAAVFAAMVLSVTALSNIIGQKLIKSQEFNFKTFLYGSLALSGLPGLFFLIQLLTGSLVIMIFSWLMIAMLIFIIAPFGLGAVLSTRFGTRTYTHTPHHRHAGPAAPEAASTPPAA